MVTSGCSNWIRLLLLKELLWGIVSPIAGGEVLSRSYLPGLLLASSVECTDMRSSSTADSSPVCDEQTLYISRGRDAYNEQGSTALTITDYQWYSDSVIISNWELGQNCPKLFEGK